ncbi:MAG: prepilin-type N-terminal cleavage/methylation domain-containing protein [Verrucomicrobia bacterium]|nr:prepilin-type N-terminal cleavage/methylation domain-containing protein [Verrucomicrobiota bacterium]
MINAIAIRRLPSEALGRRRVPPPPERYGGQAVVPLPSSPVCRPCFARASPFASEATEDASQGRLSSGFTLIEVLVAMTVLSVMVLMVANIFQSSSASWNIGTQKADMNTAARAALDFMARELQSAVAGPIEAVNPPALSDLQFELKNAGKEIRFYSLSGDPDSSSGTRAVRGILFLHDPYQLKSQRRTGVSSPFNPYSDALSFSGSQILITNVWMFQALAYASMDDLVNGFSTDSYQSNMLPICMDMAIVMLSDDDMMRATALSSDPTEQDNFVARNSKLYSTRVYFPNRVGYGGR